ncbi:MAG: hypothetical protein AAGD18_08275 [Actinomycetota bacterium]
MIEAFNVGWDGNLAEVELIRTRSHDILTAALTNEALVLHVNSHGEADAEDILIHSEDEATKYSLLDLGEHLQQGTWPIAAPALFVDACSSGTKRFQRAIRDCIAAPTVLIGGRATVTWQHSTIWSAAFYGALLRRKGRGVAHVDRILEAAGRASDAYELVTDERTPYRVELLEPTRAARKAFS